MTQTAKPSLTTDDLGPLTLHRHPELADATQGSNAAMAFGESDPAGVADYLNENHPDKHFFTLKGANDIYVTTPDIADTFSGREDAIKAIQGANAMKVEPSFLSKLVPMGIEQAGAGLGAAIGGGGGGIPGAIAGAGVGGGGGNAINQVIAKVLGVTPNLGAKDSLKQLGIHAALNAGGEGLGRVLLPATLTGTKTLAPALIPPLEKESFQKVIPAMSEAFQNSVAGRELAPSERFGALGKLAEKMGSGTPYESGLKKSGERYTKNVLGNLDENMMKMPGVGEEFFKEPLIPEGLNQNLKQAIKDDMADAKSYFNEHYGILKSDGLNALPLDKGSIIQGLGSLQMKTAEGKTALANLVDRITNDSSANLGDFHTIKSDIKSDLKPALTADAMVKSDYAQLGKELENNFKSQITDPDLKAEYQSLSSQNADYQNTLNKISKTLSREGKSSDLETIKNVRGIKPLLENLEQTESPFMERTLNVYKRGLGNELKNKVMPGGDVNWNALGQYSQNPTQMEYLKRLLPIGEDSGVGADLAKQLQSIKEISSNPVLHPQDKGVAAQKLMELLSSGPGAIAGALAKKAIPQSANPLLQAAYNPYGTAGRLLADKLNK